jgi:hypothetical protein
VLGGGANVECIGSVQRPAGVDCGVIVDQSFCTIWHNQSCVKVIWAVDLLVGRFAGITAYEMEKVEGELNLVQKFIPQL